MPSHASSRHVATVTFAVLAYLSSVAVLVYAVGFLADVGVPRTIDHGPRGGTVTAVVVDLALLAAFALQHTVMARPGFKRVWLRVVPSSLERATYVGLSSVLLAGVFLLWRPLDGVVWRVDGAPAVVVRAVYVSGWVLAVGATFLISHSDLFGLRQAWRRHRYRAPQFSERGLYRVVRHPLMVGFIVAFWAAPTMTVGHLLFAVASTAYIVVGTAFEERDLARELGTAYLDYRRRVPALVPRLRRVRVAGASARECEIYSNE